MRGPIPPDSGRGRSPLPWILAGIGCLLLLIFVGGIVAALVIPNFLTARERARQHQTVVGLREVGTALEAHYGARGAYPAATSAGELAAALVPDYAAELPATDGWGHGLRYLCWNDSGGPCNQYRLASPGRDGVFEREDLREYPGEATPHADYERDIVLADGAFLQYPGARS